MNIEGVFFLLLGIIAIIFNRLVTRHALTFYNKFNIPHVSEKGIRIAYLLGGIVFVIVGFIILFL
jgi:hypothetical protein